MMNKNFLKTFFAGVFSVVILLSQSGSQSAFAEDEQPARKLPSETKNESAHPAGDKLALLRKMQTRYKSLKTFTVEFTQKKTNLALGTTNESKGRIFLMRPNKFRWQTHEPDPSVLVSNGKKIWYYTPPLRAGEKGQVMVRHASDQSKLAVDLLSGQFDVKKDFKSKQLSDNSFDLIPLKPAGDVERVELFIEKPTNLVYKLKLFTTTGNSTELELKNAVFNPKISSATFDFIPPPNTEEIR